MLSNVITSIRMRYAFAGAAFGSIFSSLSLAYDAVFVHNNTKSLLALLQANPVHFVVGMTPLIFGYTFYKIGRSREDIVHELALRHEAERTLQHNAFHDSLTSLENRHALEGAVQETIARGVGRSNRPALLLLDLDRFKFINDTMGHNVGDEILLALSQRLKLAAGDVQRVYRLGGDEFVILWPGAPPEDRVADFCAALGRLISFPFELSTAKLATGGSLGVTWLERSDVTMSDALRRADLALYRAKEMPGTQFVFYDRAVACEAEQRMKMEKDMRLAIEEKRFFLEYQPIVNLATDRVRSFEALVRWRMGDQVIPPDMFIPIAEKSGLIVALGKWVLQEACSTATAWPADIGVSVNVAGEQFKDSGFVEFVRNSLARTGLAPTRLTIEVTESLFSVDIAMARESLLQLRGMGVRLALDDFGTGFSSISHLRSFPLDTLKIDRSFTQAMLENKREAELVAIMMKLSETFEMTTTVEGVETESQLDYIRAHGAGDVQGFFISRPVARDQVMQFIASRGRGTSGRPANAANDRVRLLRA